jgi:quinoprotein glucose dehydrogenase
LRNACLLFAALIIAALGCGAETPIDFAGPVAEWREYGGDKGGSRYSPLTQITPENVSKLEVAWEYHTGDVDDGSETLLGTAFQNTPIVVGDTLYICTPRNRVIALDAATGTERWVFDAKVDTAGMYIVTCRGVSHYFDPKVAAGGACRERIFMGTLDARMVAIDAATGRLCEGFGEGGAIDLSHGIGDRYPGEYAVTSPPAVVGDVLVTGAMVLDNIRVDAPGGVVRGYDAHSGELRWSWDPLPPGKEYIETTNAAGEVVRYQRGTANAWSILSADPERNLVFVPTGNTAPDYFGGARDGLDHYSSSVVALNAATGEVVWSFQTVHHDIWDYDVPSQPALFDFPGETRSVPALIQATKMDHLFFLDRETGEPIFGVEERPVPPGAASGEFLSPTQPFPVKPEPIHPALLDPAEAFGFSPIDRAWCRRKIASLRNEGIFTPPAVGGTVSYPSYFGGSNWGSLAIDHGRGILIANTSRVAAEIHLVPREEHERAVARAKERGEPSPPHEPQSGTPFAMWRNFLVSPLGLPCSPPPWGALTAIDTKTGEHLWEVPLGTTRDLAPLGLAFRTGVPGQGGPIVTASGLVFIGATMDDYLRAFDVRTGEELWAGRLPAGGQATPLTYRVGREGRQMVAIAAGGHAMMETTLGDSVVAFALPD